MVDWVVKSRSAVLEKLKVLASTENSFRYSSSIRSLLQNVTIDKKILKEKDSTVNNSVLELFWAYKELLLESQTLIMKAVEIRKSEKKGVVERWR